MSSSRCGFSRDCSWANYSLAAVNTSAAMWDPFNATLLDLFRLRQQEASAACAGSTRTNMARGGYCLHDTRPPNIVSLTGGRTYRSAREYPYRADATIVRQLELLLRRGNGEHLSLNDFGAGVGEYGHALQSLYTHRVRWRGYDGAGNVEDFTGGFVRWFDLSIPLALARADWVMCLEVGEHIPHEHEHTVMRNLHAHNRCGIVLSWATLNQQGISHVNNHRNAYLVGKLSALGYSLNRNRTLAFRFGPSVKSLVAYPWFRRTLLVFDRINPPPLCREAGRPIAQRLHAKAMALPLHI